MSKSQKKLYIGLGNSPHDPAIAIVNNEGELVFAEASERYLQNKRAWGCPPDDMVRSQRLLEEYLKPNTDLVLASSWSDRFIGRSRFMCFTPGLSKLMKSMLPANIHSLLTLLLSLWHRRSGANLEYQAWTKNIDTKITRKAFNHHLCHAAAACYSSPFKEAVCAVIDGHGENSSTSFYHYQNGLLKKLPIKKSDVGSLGFYYMQICLACGFDPIKGEEWKVMGLAPYGKFNKEIDSLLRSMIWVEDGVLVMKSDYQLLVDAKQFWRKKEESPLKSADLAFTAQKYFNELYCKLLSHLYNFKLSENLVLTGGCALNSAANGLLHQSVPFKESYIFSAPADDGNAVGAAYLAYHQDNGVLPLSTNIQSPYLGTAIKSSSIDKFERFGNIKRSRLPNKRVSQYAAELIAEGKIIGWIQGRAEYGPRALGNRSILADPRSPDIKERINEMVKFREEFRPFAPSILDEYGDEYFENYRSSPYMERALFFKKEMLNEVPGVVHVDGTGRLQSVKKEWNEMYYNLILSFYMITGVPIVLNTSFNVMGKPIVHSVEDAFTVFFSSGLDALIINDRVYLKDDIISKTPWGESRALKAA